nr:hypothetical protein CFP56_72143 [Quercus suber]
MSSRSTQQDLDGVPESFGEPRMLHAAMPCSWRQAPRPKPSTLQAADIGNHGILQMIVGCLPVYMQRSGRHAKAGNMGYMSYMASIEHQTYDDMLELNTILDWNRKVMMDDVSIKHRRETQFCRSSPNADRYEEKISSR